MKKKHTEQDSASAQSRSPTKTAHPHDRLFKEVFSTKEAQQDLVSMALPAEITSRFRMNTVRESGQETGSGRMDLLLTVETTDGSSEYVYVLVEHKSYPAPMVAVQLLGYIGGILKRYRKPPVPIIHPLVFYHGAKTWTVPTELTGLHELAEPDAASPPHHPPGGYPVNLRYHLFDLSTIPPEQIAERARARAYAGMISMKYIKRNLEPGDIRIIARLVARAPLPGDLWFTITTYVLDQVEQQYRQPLMTAIEENVYTEEEGKRMKSIADAIREEGLEQGKVDVLVRLLRRRFGLTAEEEAIFRECHDAERLDEAADAFADPEAGKDEILALLE